MFRHLFAAWMLAATVRAGIDLRLPTANRNLFEGKPEQFYMYVDRTFEGQTSRPWQAGSFGMVRNALRVGDEVIHTKFHEGIDIIPLERDGAGNPLDRVSGIADGVVVHASAVAGQSNYGKYVVIEHAWDGAAYYSLYAHLSEVSCQAGDEVKAGTVIGRLGYTGVGINRTRAHLHLELGMLMSRHFEDWHKVHLGGKNHHGLFNGMNLIGFDVAALFLQHKAKPELKISEFIATIPPYFKATVPARGTPDFVRRYPWICPEPAGTASSWEISFSATGLPLAFKPSAREVDAPIITSVLPSKMPHRYLTRNLVTGQDNSASLTTSGRNLVALITDDFPIATAAAQKPAAAPES